MKIASVSTSLVLAVIAGMPQPANAFNETHMVR